MRNPIKFRLSAADLATYLDEIFLSTGAKADRLHDGTYFIDPGGSELALKAIPLASGEYLIFLNPRFFKETSNA